MRFARDPFVVERLYRFDPALLKDGAAPDADEVVVLIPLRRIPQEFGDGLLFLSDVTRVMWQLLTAGESTEAIVERVVAEYDVDRARAKDDLDAFVAELCARGALVPA
jgi:hypothetical protein